MEPIDPGVPSQSVPPFQLAPMSLPGTTLPAADDGSQLDQLTALITPYFRQTLAGVHPSTGTGFLHRAEAMVMAPAWHILTGTFLPVLVQLGLQVGIKMLGSVPWVVPTIGVLIQLTPMIQKTFGVSPNPEFLAKLYAILATPADVLHPAVTAAVDNVQEGVGATGPTAVPVGFNPNRPAS